MFTFWRTAWATWSRARRCGWPAANQLVNTYVASQAAITAHTYDPAVPNYSFILSAWVCIAPHTPNIYGNWFAGNNGGGAGRIISFFNANDFALRRAAWQLDQLTKPDQSVVPKRRDLDLCLQRQH